MKGSNQSKSLLSGVANVKVDGSGLSALINTRSEASSLIVPTIKAPAPGKIDGLRTLALGADKTASGISFGSPASSGTSSSKSSSTWSNLLQQAASGGVSSLLGGGGLSAIGGLGGLISGVVSLFDGGKKTLPPLVRFSLPTSQTETIYASAKGGTTYQGSETESAASAAGTLSGQYRAASTIATSNTNQQIVNAVKHALLNSSSLNDVIAEI